MDGPGKQKQDNLRRKKTIKNVVPSLETSNLQDMKKVLRKSLKGLQDVEGLRTQVDLQTLVLGDQEVRISKLGKKKILKKIAMVTQRVEQETGSVSDREQLLVKKLRIPVGKLIIKYSEQGGNKEQTSVKSKKKKSLDISELGDTVNGQTQLELMATEDISSADKKVAHSIDKSFTESKKSGRKKGKKKASRNKGRQNNSTNDFKKNIVRPGLKKTNLKRKQQQKRKNV